MPNLVRLDVANCRLGAFSGENSNIEAIANHYKTITILDISHNDMSGSESEINKLKNMSNLTILYADDICDGFDADTITKEMVNLKLISLENNAITTLNWLTRFRGLVYVDLAGNGFTSVDLGTQIGSRNRETLKYLYLETDQPCTFANVYMKFCLLYTSWIMTERSFPVKQFRKVLLLHCRPIRLVQDIISQVGLAIIEMLLPIPP